MIPSDHFFVPPDLRGDVLAMAESGGSVEAMCQRMADANLEKIIAISLLREATHCTLSEAKVKVHFSEAYKFRRASDEAFHDALFEQLDEAGLIEPEVHSVSAS